MHRTNQRPVCRVEEDIMHEQDQKLLTIVAYAKKHKIPVLSGGDVYDTWKCGHDVVNSTNALLAGINLLSAYGQHELPNHDLSEKWRSPLTTTLLHVPHLASTFTVNGKDIVVTTCSWGEKPKVVVVPSAIHVLLLHKTVYLTEKPYPGATGNVKKLLKRPEYAQFDVIISGDNHKAFTYRSGKTLWVNCGCVYRTDASEIDYVPSYWAFFYNEEKKRVYAKRMELPYKRKNVTKRHLEQKHREKEWDSDFAKNIAEVKGARPSSFIEKIATAVLRKSTEVKKRVFEFVGE